MKERRIALLTIGTRGDVIPFLALGFALQEAGHAPRLLLPARFAGLAERLGLSATLIDFDFEGQLADPTTRERVRRGRQVRVLLGLRRVLDDAAAALDERCQEVSRDAEVIVAHSLVAGRGVALAEARRVPLVLAHATPLAPTRAFLPPVLPRATTGSGLLNRTVHRLIEALYWRGEAKPLNALRRRLGLPPQHTPTEQAAERRGDPARRRSSSASAR